MDSTPALLLAAAGVGFGHAALPDHWAPLSVLGRARREPLGRTVRRSLAAAGTHVALSLVLGAVLIGVGLGLRAAVIRYEDLVVGGLLLATGAVFVVLELSGRRHGHPHPHPHAHAHPGGHAHPHHDSDDHSDQHSDRHFHPHPHPHAPGGALAHDHAGSVGRARRLAAVAVPFGAAASPDLTILPVFLAASALGAATALGSLLVFGLVTVATMVGLTVAASLGVARLTAPWIERRANLLTAGTLLLIGAAIALGLL